jgi:hypothetical protein
MGAVRKSTVLHTCKLEAFDCQVPTGSHSLPSPLVCSSFLLFHSVLCHKFSNGLLLNSQCVCEGTPVSNITGYGLGEWGLIYGMDRTFLFATVSRLVLGTIQPPIQWLTTLLGVRQMEHEDDHSHPSRAEV